jgi:hypothetical protein
MQSFNSMQMFVLAVRGSGQMFAQVVPLDPPNVRSGGCDSSRQIPRIVAKKSQLEPRKVAKKGKWHQRISQKGSLKWELAVPNAHYCSILRMFLRVVAGCASGQRSGVRDQRAGAKGIPRLRSGQAQGTGIRDRRKRFERSISLEAFTGATVGIRLTYASTYSATHGLGVLTKTWSDRVDV